jgi:hypothetical protein
MVPLTSIHPVHTFVCENSHPPFLSHNKMEEDTGRAIAKHNHSVDYFGVAIDIRKSDVQKAIRRGLLQQALSSFFAGYTLLSLFPGNQTALAVQTNFINRLIIIAVEDVGLADPNLLRTILPILYGMSRRKIERDSETLAAVVQALVHAKTSRLCSHLFHAYKQASREKAIKEGVVFCTLDDISLETPDCFAWLETKDPKEIFALIRAHSRCTVHLSEFELLEKLYTHASAFGKANVIRYLLGLAHYLSVPETERGAYVTTELHAKAYELERVSYSMIHPLVTHDVDVFLPPLRDSVDVHTAEGRRMGHDAKRFRQVGACVEDAHEVMNDDVLERIYVSV